MKNVRPSGAKKPHRQTMDVSDCDQPIHMKHIHQNTESFLQDNFVINNFYHQYRMKLIHHLDSSLEILINEFAHSA